MRRSLVVSAIIMSLLAVGVLVGCDRPTPTILSAWPTVDSEPVVAEPPKPPVWPYTGKDAPSAAAVNVRPMSVKIENSNPARPQIGLNAADVVYETVVEGGITRFNCIFHSKVPKEVGPVRSARLSDQWVVPQYDGLLFFSGRSHPVGVVLRKHKIPVLEHGRIPAAYHRVSDRNAPHNLVLDTAQGMKEAKKRGHRIKSKAIPLEYDRRTVAATPTVVSIDIPFSQANRVEWKWDAEKGVFRRWNNGAKHLDAATDKQVTAHNVVVMWADYTRATVDKHGGITWDIDMGGEGKVAVFKNGVRYNGTWSADRSTPPTFTDKNGLPIKLTPGRTWFQVVPKDIKIKVEKP